MELKIFFDTIDPDIFQNITDPYTFYFNIRVYSEKLPDWREADIALIGLTEERGATNEPGVERAANEVRKKLYRLKKGTGAYRIVDLGNLRCGLKPEETYLRLCEVCEVLMQYNVIPVILGGTHDADYGQYLAYEKFEKLISVVNIDPLLDMEPGTLYGLNRHHTHQILVHEPNYLFNFSNIGYQTFLNDTETLKVLEKLYFDNYRIGQVKEHINNMEPIVRQADMLSFDLSSIRQSDAPGNANASPFGLSGEEACQLTWFAGMNNKLSSIGIYEYNPLYDHNGQTASVIATMIWYFIEGYYNRRPDFDFQGDDYTKFVVSLETEPHKLVFYKNKLTEKWWMEVPYPPEKEARYARVSVVPCTYNDYETANQGEIPYRWVNTHSKLI